MEAGGGPHDFAPLPLFEAQTLMWQLVRRANPSELLGSLLPGRLTHGRAWMWFSRSQTKGQNYLQVLETMSYVAKTYTLVQNIKQNA